MKSPDFAVENLIASSELRRVNELSRIGTTGDRQAELGQFFTPLAAAELIANMASLPETGTFNILDPGSGSGVLITAMAKRVLTEKPNLKLKLTALEFDPSLITALTASLKEIQAAAFETSTACEVEVVQANYLDRHESLEGKYDLVIMNPPYAKLGLKQPQRSSIAAELVDVPNLYAAFMARAITHLKKGGELASITPRSFANGVYFEEFRKFLLRNIDLTRLHLFGSRDTIFADTGVLQETVVLVGRKEASHAAEISISSSDNHLDVVSSRSVKYEVVVDPGDPHAYVRIPDEADHDLIQKMQALQFNLASFGLRASTGKIVGFRLASHLRKTPGTDVYPLLYPANFNQGVIKHPNPKNAKLEYIAAGGAEQLLLDPGTYVLIKRFSSKEEKRRISVALWEPQVNGKTKIAVDNKVNYLHLDNRGLKSDLAKGIYYWLASTQVDRYFRSFSGHTQVNASDLNQMHFPAESELLNLNQKLNSSSSQAEIDEAVTELLDGLSVT